MRLIPKTNMKKLIKFNGLNPCCNGMRLIQILNLSFMRNSVCLNPCCNGMRLIHEKDFRIQTR